MSSVVVIGAQWGDEGKGKIVDYLAQKADAVVRYSGGSNAGHTVVVNDVSYKLRLLPSGVLYSDKTNVLGNGVVINPGVVLHEIADMKLKASAATIWSFLTVRMWCCLTMPVWMNCRKQLWAVIRSVRPKAVLAPAIWIRLPVPVSASVI